MSEFKTIIYARVSTKEQAKKDKNSLGNQLKKCEAVIKNKKWELVRKPIEDIESGESIEKRDGMNWILQNADKGIFNLVVVADFDRMSRDPADFFTISRELRKKGVQIYSVEQSSELDQPDNINYYNDKRLMEQTFSAFKSGIEIHSTRRRYWQGMANKVARGEIPHPARPPYGYRSRIKGTQKMSERGGHKIEWELYVYKPEAKIIKRIFDDYIKNKSYRNIAHQLTRDGIPTSAGKENWHYMTIKLMLENPVYAGLVRWQFKKVLVACSGKQIRQPKDKWIIHKGNHPAIILPKKFEMVQEIIKSKSRMAGRHSQGKALLSGIIVCSHCGKKMYSISKTKTAPAHYMCSLWNQHRQCVPNYINMTEVDEEVIETIVGMIKDKNGFVKKYNESLKKKKSDESEVKLFEDKLADLKGRRERILDAYEAGGISLDEMTDRRTNLDDKISEAEKQLKEAVGKSKIKLSRDEILDKLKNIEDFKKYIKKNKEYLRTQLMTLLNKVEVTRVKKGEQKIKIDFKKI